MPDAPDRIFNQNGHPHYGASRRIWVVMATCCPDLDLLDESFFAEWGCTWDAMFVELVNAGDSEEAATRSVVWRAIDGYPD